MVVVCKRSVVGGFFQIYTVTPRLNAGRLVRQTVQIFQNPPTTERLHTHRSMKLFPFDHDSKKEILFYPEKPQIFEGDILEIGPGRGDVLLKLASLYPGKRLVAVEIAKKRFFRLIPRLERHKLSNVLLMNGDARMVLPPFFKEASFESILVLFPDPWPKKRHAFRRLLSVEFLWLLAHQLRPGGHLFVGSDVQNYIEWVIENLKEVNVLENTLYPNLFATTLPELPKTFFEEKWRKEGREIFFLKLRKKD